MIEQEGGYLVPTRRSQIRNTEYVVPDGTYQNDIVTHARKMIAKRIHLGVNNNNGYMDLAGIVENEELPAGVYSAIDNVSGDFPPWPVSTARTSVPPSPAAHGTMDYYDIPNAIVRKSAGNPWRRRFVTLFISFILVIVVLLSALTYSIMMPFKACRKEVKADFKDTSVIEEFTTIGTGVIEETTFIAHQDRQYFYEICRDCPYSVAVLKCEKRGTKVATLLNENVPEKMKIVLSQNAFGSHVVAAVWANMQTVGKKPGDSPTSGSSIPVLISSHSVLTPSDKHYGDEVQGVLCEKIST